MDDLQSGEECYQRSSPTDVSLMSASQPGDHAKGLGIPRESDFESQWDLITELSKNWGKHASNQPGRAQGEHEGAPPGSSLGQQKVGVHVYSYASDWNSVA